MQFLDSRFCVHSAGNPNEPGDRVKHLDDAARVPDVRDELGPGVCRGDNTGDRQVCEQHRRDHRPVPHRSLQSALQPQR